MNTLRQSLFILSLLAVLIYSGWHFSNKTQKFQLDNETLSSIPDYMVSNLQVKQFDKQGALANQLTAPYMEHIPKGDINLLQNPHVIVAQKDESTWDIRSLKAKAFNGGEKITFMEDVIIHQSEVEKGSESTMKTQEITYFPKEKRASTNLLVSFERPGNFIQSKGMNAFLDEKRIELLHQARGSYVPAKG